VIVTTIWVDRRVRTPNGTCAPLEDANGPLDPGDVVHVVETETGLLGGALVTAVDRELKFVYLSLAWDTLTAAYGYRGGAVI
jgi:hypothetical protein